MALYGGIEAGGTKFVCAVGSGPHDMRAEARFPTTSPDATLARTVEFFQEQQKQCGIAAIGIAAFGPVDPDPASERYGYITTTPKLRWQHTDFAGMIANSLDVPVGFDTDVNGAALAEHRWGAAQGLHTFVYWTVGTGLGGGGMVNGRLLHGLMHPEMGHMWLDHDWDADPFEGACPFHGDCLEGLASGTAIEERWGAPGEDLPDDHKAWRLEAYYLAQGLVNVITIVSPQRIILGGGVMAQPQLLPMVRKEVQKLLNGYIQMPQILTGIDEYIVRPRLGGRAGVLGAIALAQDAAEHV